MTNNIIEQFELLLFSIECEQEKDFYRSLFSSLKIISSDIKSIPTLMIDNENETLNIYWKKNIANINMKIISPNSMEWSIFRRNKSFHPTEKVGKINDFNVSDLKKTISKIDNLASRTYSTPQNNDKEDPTISKIEMDLVNL